MQAFEAIRIIDLTRVLAGPYVSYQFALLGADVIKVEPILSGESTRWRSEGDMTLGGFGMSPSFITQGSNKRSLTLNINTEQGQKIFLELIKTADVVIENLRTGSMDKRGIGYDDARKVNPGIIYCSVTGYGQTGPKARYPAYDSVIQAASGFMSVTGTETSGPLKAGPPVVDYAMGHAGSFAIAAALFHRQRTGQGQHIDLSMLDTTLTLMASLLTTYVNTGKAPARRGNEAPSRSPASTTFETLEGLLAIAINEQHQFESLMQSIGLGPLLEDPRFGDAASRRNHTALLRNEIGQALLLKPAVVWEQILNEAGVPASRVVTVPEVLEDPQVTSREFFKEFTANECGLDKGIKVPLATAYKFKTDGPKINTPPPRVGAHTDELLRSLGYDDCEIQSFRDDGIV